MKPFVFGIAGFIGSGKTEAGRFFETLGAEFIDADKLVNDLYREGNEGYRKMVNYFGKDFLKKDGSLDRKKIAKFVFADLNKLTILNQMIHPLVANEVQKRIDASRKRVVALESTYFELKHLGRMVDAILWIDCYKEILKRRVLKRKDMTEDLFEKVYHSQRRPEWIDEVVENNGSLESFFKRLKKIWDKWQ